MSSCVPSYGPGGRWLFLGGLLLVLWGSGCAHRRPPHGTLEQTEQAADAHGRDQQADEAGRSDSDRASREREKARRPHPALPELSRHSPPLPSATRPDDCPEKGTVVRQVGVTPEELDELSGLVASRRHPGIFWAHNDSDNDFVLYALDAEARVRAAFPLVGVKPLDVEAVALIPCGEGEGACILLGDIGDNRRSRSEVQLLRLPEPDQLDSRELKVEVLPFVYEDEPHDAESLIVEAGTNRIFVLTKPLGAIGHLYLVEGLAPGEVGRARRVHTLPSRGLLQRAATDASLSPDGSRLLVRTYFGVWEWAGPGAASIEELVSSEPRRLDGPSQPQGEAIAFLPDGSGYLLGSEKAGAPFYRVDCLAPPRSPVLVGRGEAADQADAARVADDEALAGERERLGHLGPPLLEFPDVSLELHRLLAEPHRRLHVEGARGVEERPL
jgi:hypothetical protein